MEVDRGSFWKRSADEAEKARVSIFRNGTNQWGKAIVIPNVLARSSTTDVAEMNERWEKEEDEWRDFLRCAGEKLGMTSEGQNLRIFDSTGTPIYRFSVYIFLLFEIIKYTAFETF